MTITDFLKEKFKYDNYGQFIWLVEPNGNHQKIADLRGWGRIQHLFESKGGKIDMDAAGKFQDELGQWVVDTLNSKLLESPAIPSVVGRELLIDFAQQYYSDEETCIHNVDLYISQHPVRKVSDEEIEKWAHEKYSLNNNCKTIEDFDFNSIIAFQYEGAVNAAKAMRDGKIPISQPNNE